MRELELKEDGIFQKSLGVLSSLANTISTLAKAAMYLGAASALFALSFFLNRISSLGM
jgi:hypothetical protein